MKYSLEALLSRVDSNDGRLRMILVGTNAQIVQTIHQLHSLGFADVNDWSPVLPLPNSDSLFSLLTR
ncbi:hypothetical protein [Leptolyngbya sp. NIES-2104]|uniref:hypothetical protein n=1 Tax=Leptolyngbya sp. NIES-2104 TaxID=1552121 RepID=UPI0006ECCAD6|nr:hypothetical protein [Leptolyngbya sp. NIES-2104]GAP96354.1 hypothetical protein NIES2104_28910 [Leptolyngbya sp. NIES-2104]